MLKDLTSENLIRLNIEATDWEDAVRKAAQPLLEAGKVKQSYIDDIIVGAKESGPYLFLHSMWHCRTQDRKLAHLRVLLALQHLLHRLSLEAKRTIRLSICSV